MYCGYRTERRKHQRLRVTLSALCRISGPERLLYLINGNEFEAETHDMSEGGLSLMSRHFIPEGAKLFIKLLIFESDHTGVVKFYEVVRLFAEVRGIVVEDEEIFRIGVKFTDMTSEKEDKVFDILHSSLQREPMPRFTIER